MTEIEDKDYMFAKVPDNRGFESRTKRILRQSVVGLNWDGFNVGQFSQEIEELSDNTDQDSANKPDESRPRQ